MAVITALQVVRKINEIMRSSPDHGSKQVLLLDRAGMFPLEAFVLHKAPAVCVGFYLSVMCLMVNEMDIAPHLSDLML